MYKKYSSILFFCLALSACGGSSDMSSTTANLLQNTPLEATSNDYISGRVTSYDSGAGLQNIQVSAGEHTTITDADGRYSLSGTPPPSEGGENVDWSTYLPGTEAPNIAWEVFEFVVANDGSFTVVPLNNWLPQTEWNGQAPPVQ